MGGTKLEVGVYLVLASALTIGAVILGDVVLGIGAALAALALLGALIARRSE